MKGSVGTSVNGPRSGPRLKPGPLQQAVRRSGRPGPGVVQRPLPLGSRHLRSHVSRGLACVCFPRPTRPSECRLRLFRPRVGQGLGRPRGSQTRVSLSHTASPPPLSLGQGGGLGFPPPSFSQKVPVPGEPAPEHPLVFPSGPGHSCHSVPPFAHCVSPSLCPGCRGLGGTSLTHTLQGVPFPPTSGWFLSFKSVPSCS